ncbi:glycoside hydrolase family 31 protein [Algoriphagus sp. CAU 1675]|uniref:glycoside hydrolase family 31 protein n=1 Tax=Algoriphagus sp. CAU 1675 TaxID=3032597 RepID=UPI0023DBB807|nr:glycoside hydrolase family 31 protein [Algoriphagus sp. CAU 1675]MDF2158103.1 glycoside hydrolase family 31 protein [Algoriphagus sp. CAU 1675]
MKKSSTPVTITQNSSRFLSMGKVLEWKQTETGISGISENGFFKLSVYEEGTIRIQASRHQDFDPNPYSVVSSPKKTQFTLREKSGKLHLETSKLNLQINLLNFSIQYFSNDGKLLNADDQLGIGWIGTEVSCFKQVQENEKFIGLGEKTGNLNRAGKAYTNWNTDYFAYGVGDDPLYMSIPFYLGIHENGTYGIFFDNTHQSVFNFGASNNRFIYFSAVDGDMDYYFIHEPSVSGIISKYTELTGRMKLPPKWALGYQQCRYSYYPDKEVLTLASTFRDKNIPADVIYLDIHHMESYKVFTFDGVKFPDAKGMIKALKSKGFKVVVILDPGIKTEKGYLPYDEAKKKDLFVKYPDGSEYQAQVWPGWCAFPDFTKEKTRSWWAEKMEFYIEAGVDGFWTDMNEPASWGQFTPNLIEFDFEGQTASHRKARNIYGMQMAKSTQEGSLLHKKDERPFVLTRSGFSGIQRFAAAWTGDNVSSDEHMLAGVRLVNSLGLSGVAFSGYDVGGFAGEASKGLFARWISIGAFAPFFRSHSMINTNDSEPWSFGEEVEEISKNYIQLRYKLLPTIYSKFYLSTLSGLPISASLAIDYPSDPKIFQTAYQNQYLFCDSFLIAPVESTKEIAKVYLPKGSWYYFYSDEIYDGEREIYLDTPLSYLPVLIKSGSIFTSQSTVFNSEEKHDGILQVHVYQGAEGSTFVHYEDDGRSHRHEKGIYFKREIKLDTDSLSLVFGEAEGQYKSDYDKLRIYFHGFSSEVVNLNGKSIKLKSENHAFLGRLTEFDPLPEHNHPYYEIQDLKYLEAEHSSEKIEITGLF